MKCIVPFSSGDPSSLAVAFFPSPSIQLLYISTPTCYGNVDEMNNYRRNKIRKMYSLEYAKVPKVFLMPHTA
jgi:hypothetical protein